MDFVSVEMPSVLLMAAVRNVQIVCAHFCSSFLSNKILSCSNFLPTIANLWLVVQARPTMYQVVKDMVDKMGYTVSRRLILPSTYLCQNRFQTLDCLVYLFLFQVKLVRVTKRVQEAYFAELHLAKVNYLVDRGETVDTWSYSPVL